MTPEIDLRALKNGIIFFCEATIIESKMGNYIEEKVFKHPDWQPYSPENHAGIPEKLRSRLLDVGSLSDYLEESHPNFYVSLLSESWGAPGEEEARIFNLKTSEKIWQRRVKLMLGDSCGVYAETWVPPSTVNQLGASLLNLGEEPIGHLLFQSDPFKREKIWLATVDNGMSMFKQSAKDQTNFWARRSLFKKGEASLIIFELFLSESWYE